MRTIWWLLVLLVNATYALTAPLMGTSANYAVLAATSVLNAGAGITTIEGSLGIAPGNSIQPNIVIYGSIDLNDTASRTAMADAQSCYSAAAALTGATTLNSSDLSGQHLMPGLYRAPDGACKNSGTLLLDANNDPTTPFVFQCASLTFLSNSNMLVAGGAMEGNVFWIVNGSVSFGTGANSYGNLYSLGSIALGSGGYILGRVISLTSSVTCNRNYIEQAGTIYSTSTVAATTTASSATTSASATTTSAAAATTTFASATTTTTTASTSNALSTTTAAAVSTSVAASTTGYATTSAAAAATLSAATTGEVASTTSFASTAATSTSAASASQSTAAAAGSAATTSYASSTSVAATTNAVVSTSLAAASTSLAAATTTGAATSTSAAASLAAASTTAAAGTTTAALASTTAQASTVALSTTGAASATGAAVAVSTSAAAAAATLGTTTAALAGTTTTAATSTAAAAATSVAASTTGSASTSYAATTSALASTTSASTAAAAGAAATTSYASITTSAAASTSMAAATGDAAATTSAAASLTAASTTTGASTTVAAAVTGVDASTTTAAALTASAASSTTAGASLAGSTAAAVSTSAASASTSVAVITSAAATSTIAAATTSNTATTAIAASTTTATTAGAAATSTLAATTTGSATASSTAAATTSLAASGLSTISTTAAVATSTAAAATTTGQWSQTGFASTTTGGTGSPQPTCAPPDFFGLPLPRGSSSSSAQNRAQASQFWTTANGAGHVASLSVYIGDVDAPPHDAYQMALYATDPTTLGPGALLGRSAVGRLRPLQWNTVPMLTPVYVFAATAYWIAYNTNSSSGALNNYLVDSLTPTRTASAPMPFGVAWPEPFDAAAAPGGAFAMYATLTGCASRCATPGPLGKATVGEHLENCTQNLAYGSIYTTGELGGTVESLSVYVRNAQTTAPDGLYQLGIYTTSVGGSNNFIGRTAIGVLQGDGWNTLPMVPPVYLHPARQYYLTTEFRNQACLQNQLTYSTGAFGGGSIAPDVVFGAFVNTVPDSFQTVNNRQYAIYASFSDSCQCQTPPYAGIDPASIGDYQEDSCASQYILGSRVQATATGQVPFVRMFIGNAAGTLAYLDPASAFRLAVYSSNGSQVGSLMQVSLNPIVGLQPYRWNQVQFQPPLLVVEGHWYWVMLASAANSCAPINSPFFQATPGVFNAVELPLNGGTWDAFPLEFPNANATYRDRIYASYMVYASNCTVSPTVACCQGHSCYELAPDNCAQIDGVSGPPGSTCQNYACAQQAGHACCFDDNSCGVYPDAETCLEYGGISYSTDNTSCADSPCPVPLEGCCLGSGCSNETRANCALRGGVSAACGSCYSRALGACCMRDSSCQVFVDNSTCSLNGGATFAENASCAATACPLPTTAPPATTTPPPTPAPAYACCFGASCFNATFSDCTGIGGVTLGTVACSQINCAAQASGACCLADGACAVFSNALTCSGLGGVNYLPGSTCIEATCGVVTSPPPSTAPVSQLTTTAAALTTSVAAISTTTTGMALSGGTIALAATLPAVGVFVVCSCLLLSIISSHARRRYRRVVV